MLFTENVMFAFYHQWQNFVHLVHDCNPINMKKVIMKDLALISFLSS
jgi:hypothetical protein